MNPRQAKKLGTFIRDARQAAGLTQMALGEQVGVPNSTILRLERGENLTPRPDLLSDIADVLRIDLADLFALADYAAPSGLPNLAPYLRTKYRDLTASDVKAISTYAANLAKQRGVDLNGPAPGEDETPEGRPPRRKSTKPTTKGGKK
jgi:transcriptional regulator with XRE-family HTH domain